MRSLLATTLLILLLSVISTCENVTIIGGENVIADNTTTIGNSHAPAYRIDGRSHTITEYRDPSKYKAPEVPIVVPSSNNTSKENLNPGYVTTEVSSVVFTHTGLANGTGTYSEWRSMKDIEGAKVKQSSYTNGGELYEEREDIFVSDYSDAGSVRELYTRNYLSFQGGTYNERECYRPDEGLIYNTFRVGEIVKESRYLNLVTHILPDKYNPYVSLETKNSSAEYRINTRFLGHSILKTRFTNNTEISEEYVGLFNIDRTISSFNRSRNLSLQDTWLPCCQVLY